MQKKHFVKIGDVYCRQESRTQKYFAFQIIEEKEDSLVYLLLDYFCERKPDEKDFPKMQPLYRQRWFFCNASINLCHANTKDFPSDAVLVGNMAPLVTEKCNAYGSWPKGYDFVGEAEWLTFPEETRYRFKKGHTDTSEITVAGITMRRCRQQIDDELLSAMTNYVIELYELPVAYNFVATRFYPQLIPFLESRHTARELDWTNHGQKELDLSRTHLNVVSIDDENMLLIKLPQSCSLLSFKGKIHPDLKVEVPDCGKDLMIQIDVEKQNNSIPNLYIPNLYKLALLSVSDLDLAQIPRYYPHLNSLRLVGKPGNVKNIHSLGMLKELNAGLLLENIFGFTAEEFPTPESWPNLMSISLESVPEEAGKHIKKVFKGKVPALDIRKLRKPEWLAENLDNPLRHWDGSEFVPKSKFKKAVMVYRDARRAALSAAANYVKDKDPANLQKQLEKISVEYVEVFNKLDARTNWIMTEEREDICIAFDAILSAVNDVAGSEFKMDTSQIYDIMNEHRDW